MTPEEQARYTMNQIYESCFDDGGYIDLSLLALIVAGLIFMLFPPTIWLPQVLYLAVLANFYWTNRIVLRAHGF